MGRRLQCFPLLICEGEVSSAFLQPLSCLNFVWKLIIALLKENCIRYLFIPEATTCVVRAVAYTRLLYSWNGDSCELSSDGGAMPQDYIEGGFVQLFVVVTYVLSLGNAKLK